MMNTLRGAWFWFLWIWSMGAAFFHVLRWPRFGLTKCLKIVRLPPSKTPWLIYFLVEVACWIRVVELLFDYRHYAYFYAPPWLIVIAIVLTIFVAGKAMSRSSSQQIYDLREKRRKIGEELQKPCAIGENGCFIGCELFCVAEMMKSASRNPKCHAACYRIVDENGYERS